MTTGTADDGFAGDPVPGGASPWFTESNVSLGPVTLRLASGPNNGPLLLLVHGVGRSWRDYAPFIPAFMPLWHVLAVDLRGHGGSSRVAGAYLVRDYLADITALVRELNRPVVIYGHSLGALLAASTAAECPDLVRAVVAEDPPSPGFLARVQQVGYGPLFQRMQQLAGTSRDISGIARELGDVVIGTNGSGRPLRLRDTRDGASIRFSARWLADLDPAVYSPILERRWLEGLDFPDLWSRVHCPTLVLAGDESFGGMLPVSDAREIMQRLTDGTLIEFPQIGHQIHWLAREATLRAVWSFLESLS